MGQLSSIRNRAHLESDNYDFVVSSLGFVGFNFASEYGSAMQDLAKWVAEGKLKWRESRIRGFGLRQYMEALDMLFDGKNIGKVMLEVAEPTTTLQTTA